MKFLAIPLLFLVANADNCGSSRDNTSSDSRQRAQQERLSEESNRQVGMPGITKFTEKRLFRMIMELRDQEIATYAYIPDLQGRLWHLCDAVGYGLPYSTEYTNPQRLYDPVFHNSAVLPQADPNGLFMPSSAEGTWIACVDENRKNVRPVYVEPRVIVSPFKLKASGEYQDR